MNLLHTPLSLPIRYLTVVFLFSLWITPVLAEFRTWKDKNGNSIHAELVKKFGSKVVLRDKKGKIYKLDPAKLSKEDQLYLNPPPPKPPPKKNFNLDMVKRSTQLPLAQQERGDNKTQSYVWEFSFRAECITFEAQSHGLKGALLVVGEDEKSNYVVIDKVEGPLQPAEGYAGQLEGEVRKLTTVKNKDGKMIKGTKYEGFLILLYSSADELLQYSCSHSFLYDNRDKLLALPIGTRFTKNLEVIKKEAK